MFGQVQRTCRFLAEHHHNQRNLDILSSRYASSISFQRIMELTGGYDELGQYQYNSTYGSSYNGDLSRMRFPRMDWVDDFDLTGTYCDWYKYKYNLGQAHAIDDFDDGSVWMYITMLSPRSDYSQVVEVEDVMPFVFWWSNRGNGGNGPSVDCYGLMGNSKLNMDDTGHCYESPMPRKSEGKDVTEEQRWHAVQRTLGVDFSIPENGGVILAQDDSGNVYRGAFDPLCAGTNSKWKVHQNNSFGANQHEDQLADKYWMGLENHGSEIISNGLDDEFAYELNNDICESIKGRPMTWNLWNVIRHCEYVNRFANPGRKLGTDESMWLELEDYTRKTIRNIYRTFYGKYWSSEGRRSTFYSVDGTLNNNGEHCDLPWTNCFVQVSSVL